MADTILRVLLIDDSRTQYVMVSDFLHIVSTATSEYTVEWASTYEEGRQLLENNIYDVCLVDYELGDKSGLDLMQEAVEKQISIPMILLTGHGNYALDLQAMHAGAADYLDKTTLKPKVLERSIRYATQNQRMLENERRQRLVTEALLDTALALNSTLESDEVLERILVNMKNVIPHDAANIFLIDDKEVRLARSQGYSDEEIDVVTELLRRKASKMATLTEMIDTGQPIIINDTVSSQRWITATDDQPIRSYLGVPIIIQDEVIGFLNFDGYETNKFSEEHAHYAQIFAQQAAQAIRNTRAYQQAQVLAATQERQRLARDLHDAVSQTLFSASVIAQTLPRLVKVNPDEVTNGLEELNRLNRGALAEMRTLLVELRPQALVETDLPTLLRNLVHAFSSRSQATVESRINYAAPLPENVHIAFYRVAQEALNNIRKYAEASYVTIDLLQNNSHLELSIADNGTGFDTNVIPSGHFGLKIMRERADSITGQLKVESEIGRGTIIKLIWHISDEGQIE
jgi:signal transduction histidine kinase